MFFAQYPVNNKTIVENKAYNLPNGVIKLMTPILWALCPQKINHLWEGDFSKSKTLILLRPKNIFPKCYDSPGQTIWGGTSKVPCPTWGRS